MLKGPVSHPRCSSEITTDLSSNLLRTVTDDLPSAVVAQFTISKIPPRFQWMMPSHM